MNSFVSFVEVCCGNRDDASSGDELWDKVSNRKRVLLAAHAECHPYNNSFLLLSDLSRMRQT